MLDFHSILNDRGFSAENYDFESTIIGFSYDIEFALFDFLSPFGWDCSQINRCWDNSEAYIHAILIPVDGDIDRGTKFLLDRWCATLRYQDPIREVVSTDSSGTQSVLRMLTMTKSNAMTLKFTIRKESI